PELPIQPDRAETGRSDKRVLAAISYTSNWPVSTLRSPVSDAPGEWTGATPANCQSSPTEPMKEAEVTWLLAISYITIAPLLVLRMIMSVSPGAPLKLPNARTFQSRPTAPI